MSNATLERISRLAALAALLAILAFPITARAQTPANQAALALPDAPGESSTSGPQTNFGSASTSASSAKLVTSPSPGVPSGDVSTHKIIEPGQPVSILDAGDKILFGLRNSVSPFSALGWVSAASYSQLQNNSPNYGTDGRAFAQRLGAAALRHTSQDVLTDSVMSTALHEDPRYFVLGRTHNPIARVAYAATRPLIGRTDSGRATPNFALLSGNLAGSAVTNLYYPSSNRSASQTFATFGGSLGGSAIGFLIDEFYGDFKRAVHARH